MCEHRCSTISSTYIMVHKNIVYSTIQSTNAYPAIKEADTVNTTYTQYKHTYRVYTYRVHTYRVHKHSTYTHIVHTHIQSTTDAYHAIIE